nr:cytochrome P450 [Nocardioides sp. B-3]
MKAFFDHPDQWELFKKERPQTTVDEIIRWATPVTVFQRTATIDTEVSGQQIKAGQRVGIFYASANHDDEVFTDPDTFDVTRDPNPHVAFGGHGAHYCIGANLGPARGRDHVQRDRRPDARHRGRRARAAPAVGVDQRDQGAPGPLRDLTDSRPARSGCHEDCSFERAVLMTLRVRPASPRRPPTSRRTAIRRRRRGPALGVRRRPDARRPAHGPAGRPRRTATCRRHRSGWTTARHRTR